MWTAGRSKLFTKGVPVLLILFIFYGFFRVYLPLSPKVNERRQGPRLKPERVCADKLFTQQTPENYKDILVRESQHYTASRKFMNKIREADAQWQTPSKIHSGRFGAIHGYLKRLIGAINSPEPSVLELGFGAGTNMLVVHEFLRHHGQVWGIELTQGWVDHAQSTYKRSGLHFLQGDITDAQTVLPRPIQFDLMFLADVWEHIPAYRLEPLWKHIVALLKPEGKLYVHIPNVAKQKAEQSNGQFFEEIVRVDDLREQARCYGMKIEEVGTDDGAELSYESIVFAF